MLLQQPLNLPEQLPLHAMLLFPIILLLPTMVFFLIFLRSGLKTKQNMFWYLTLLFGFYTLSPIFQMGSLAAVDQATANIYYLIYQVIEIIAMLLLILVLEMFDKNAIFSGRFTFFSILASLAVGAILSKPELVSSTIGFGFTVSFASFSMAQILQAIFLIVAGLWLVITLIKNRKDAISPPQKKLITYLLFGVIFTNILSTLSIIPLQIFQLLNSFPFFHTIGMVLVGLAFKRVSKSPWLLQRQTAHLLLVYLQEGGVNVYSHSFSHEMNDNELVLLAGGFSAVTTFFKEATKASGTVHSINLEGRELRLISRERFVVALLIDYITQGSEMALVKFA